jgi:5-methylthioadenosine/S-adenosylhomocysteine deaminase
MIAIRIDGPHYVPLLTAPRHTVVNHLVYAASGADVSEVFVDGVHVIRDHMVTTVNERDVIEDAQRTFEGFVGASGIGAQIDKPRWSSGDVY